MAAHWTNNPEYKDNIAAAHGIAVNAINNPDKHHVIRIGTGSVVKATVLGVSPVTSSDQFTLTWSNDEDGRVRTNVVPLVITEIIVTDRDRDDA